jgi:hypothetical protein
MHIIYTICLILMVIHFNGIELLWPFVVLTYYQMVKDYIQCLINKIKLSD